MLNLDKIKDISTLVRRAKWLEGKTLAQVSEEINRIAQKIRV